jgi:hypothetical protein
MVNALVAIGGQRAIDTLATQLETAEAEDKTFIANALQALGDERGANALIAPAISKIL